MNGTKKSLVIKLATARTWDSRAHLARAVGVSREFVRQVVEETGIHVTNFHTPLLRWPCPGCGKEVKHSSHPNAAWTTLMTAHCVKCRKTYYKTHCHRDHSLTSKNTNSRGHCKICTRRSSEQIISYRICEDCDVAIPVTRNLANQMRNGPMKGRWCLRCFPKNRLNKKQ